MTYYTKHNPQTIQSLFNTVAKKYELTNFVLSFGLHRYWNNQCANEIIKHLRPTNHSSLLDICAGTGDITYRVAKKRAGTFHLLDFSKNMLDIARQKKPTYPLLDRPSEFYYHECDAHKLPFENNSFDAVTVAYGIRNMHDPKLCLQECVRVLRPNGICVVLELTKPQSRMLRFLHTLFTNTIVPVVGRAITKNKEAYQYLNTSIHTFLSPHSFTQLATECHFSPIEVIPLSGGITTLYVLQKT